MVYNSRQQVRTNMEMIRAVLSFPPGKRLEQTQRDTPADHAVFGGLKAMFFPQGGAGEQKKLNAWQNEQEYYPPIMELRGWWGKLSKYHFKRAVDFLQGNTPTTGNY